LMLSAEPRRTYAKNAIVCNKGRSVDDWLRIDLMLSP
jgi:hypothetical protein